MNGCASNGHESQSFLNHGNTRCRTHNTVLTIFCLWTDLSYHEKFRIQNDKKKWCKMNYSYSHRHDLDMLI